MLSHVRLFATPWTVAHQAPLSMGFSRQEYWSWLPFPSPGDLPDPGIEPLSTALAGGFFIAEPSRKPIAKRKHLRKYWRSLPEEGPCLCSCQSPGSVYAQVNLLLTEILLM